MSDPNLSTKNDDVAPGTSSTQETPVKSDDDDKKNWQEHKDQAGNTYWYNKETKKSSWTNPFTKQSPEELENGGWMAYKKDDATYYFNTITQQTTWTKPSCMKKSDELKEKKTKKQLKREFKEMLDKASIHHTWEWEQVLKIKLLDEDSRYQALKPGERKAAYHEWQESKRKKTKDDALTSKKLARDNFRELLMEKRLILPIKSCTPFEDVRSRLQLDERWDSLDSEQAREDVYDDFLYDVKQLEKQDEKEQRKNNMIAFHHLLAETKEITVQDCHWRTVQERLTDDARFQALSNLDRLIVFEDYVEEIKHKHEEEKLQREESARKNEKQAKQKWMKFLVAQHKEGKILWNTKWKEFAGIPGDGHEMQENPTFKEITTQLGVAYMNDVFDDYVDELKQAEKTKRKREKKQSDEGAPVKKTKTDEVAPPVVCKQPEKKDVPPAQKEDKLDLEDELAKRRAKIMAMLSGGV